MSISLEAARRNLDILEQLHNKPELILTDLFSDNMSNSFFLYYLSIDNKNIMDYLKEYLLGIYPFKDCIIGSRSYYAYNMSFYISSLKDDIHLGSKDDDLIAKINVENKTYKLFLDCITEYKDIINKKYELKITELDDFWKRFIDLSLKGRIRQINRTIHSEYKFTSKCENIFFWLIMTRNQKRKIKEVLDKEINKIEVSNKYIREEYEKDIKIQPYYKEFTLKQIRTIQEKQKEIEDFLLIRGYREDDTISSYY